YSSVATLSNGDFVVAWESKGGQDGEGDGVFGQLFNGAGDKIGNEFQVNNFTTGDQEDISVASFNNGNFIVTWESPQDGDSDGVYAQLFYGNSSKIGNEFLINTNTISNQQDPFVTSFPNGNFVVTWTSLDQDGSNDGIFGQIFDGNGSKIGNEFQVNNYTANGQRSSVVAILRNGNFVVTWRSDLQDGSGWGIYGQIFRDNITLPSSTSASTSRTTSSSLSSDSSTSTQPSSTSISIPSQPPSSSTSSSFSSSVQGTSSNSVTSDYSRSSFSTSQTPSSIFTSIIPTSTKRTTGVTSSLKPSNSGTNPIGSSPSGEKNISWLWASLGAVGGAIYLGLTGYFLLRKRSRQQEKDLSVDSERAEIPLRDVRSEGSAAHIPSEGDQKGKTIPKAPPIPSGIEDFPTHTRTRKESRLPSVRDGKGYTRIGKKYDLINKISRKEARILLAQTGIEIAFQEGKSRTKVQLGEGNFGKLRISRNAETTEFVGVKKVKGSDKIAQSQNEGVLQMKLKGMPNIMPILDFVESIGSEEEPVLYQFMPLAGFGNGNELKGRLGGIREFPERQEQILTHVAQGLLTGFSHMHKAHIYHFDMHLGNMVFDKKGETFIIDFGCAKEIPGGIVREEVLGDTRYYSPERWAFSRQIYNDYHPEAYSASKADAWSLGVSLLEIAIGAYPFDRTDFNTRLKSWDSDYFQRKLDAIPALKSPAPDSVMAVVKGLLHVDPKKRLSIDDALAQLSTKKPFSDGEEQERVFADLKRGESYFAEPFAPAPRREQDANYMDVFCRQAGIHSLQGYDVRISKSEAEGYQNTGSIDDAYQNEFGT
ncbi:MAG: hypothetical protein KR126chlam3_01000, partial [Chlamydiae bacterium]|nr:hypothetical protein [Chlamydiota bacterium]